jgi:FecR protein/Protein of unknown function (DUF3352)/Putative zinc-finger
MKPSNNELNEIIERTTGEIRNQAIDPSVVSGAADRVWKRLSERTADASAVQVDHIRNCADFQTLIPSYLNGSLSPARAMLLEDHTHECVPCRKALKETRFGVAPTAPQQKPARPFASRRTVVRWAVAAAVIIGVLSIGGYEKFFRATDAFNMVVHAMDGQVYLVSDNATEALTVGEQFKQGQKVRTAKDAGAVVKLPDGSLIEMRERSEFSVTDSSQGTTIHLDRGNIIVQAAKQRERHLYVDTGDCTVAVTGTIFAVNAGTKGSRVSVVEGEVHVDHSGKKDVLHPGDQVTTSQTLANVPVSDEIGWSRDAARYKTMLAEVAALRKEIDQNVAGPGVRYSTRLLEMTPDDTVFYIAIPNLSETIAESNKIIEQRLAENPELRQWWDREQASSRGGQEWNEIISKITEFGAQLGDEIVVTAQMSAASHEPDGPLVFTTLKDAAGFRTYADRQLGILAGTSKKRADIRFIDDPMSAGETANGKSDLFVWINGDVLAASPKLEMLQRVASNVKAAGAAQFADGSFRSRIAEVYQEGAGFIVAADLERIIASSRNPNEKEDGAFRQLGITSLRHFIAEVKEDHGKSYNRAVLTFKPEDHGIVSWLAAPGPMGALQFISPDANIVAAFVVKKPVALVDDLLAALNTVDPKFRENLDQFQRESGLDIRNDFAAPLGGEFAFAIDGPVLPTPSWKMIFEVYDPAHLQQTFERVVDLMNEQAHKAGKQGLAWERTDSAGRTFYTLKSLDFGLEVNYTYANGYMVAGPSRALVDRSVKYRETGYTILHSPKFIAALPEDKQANFSALLYHNLGSVIAPIAGQVKSAAGSLPPEGQRALKSLGAPMLAYAYAQGDRISFAVNGEEGPLGLKPSSLLGMPGGFGLDSIIKQSMR